MSVKVTPTRRMSSPTTTNGGGNKRTAGSHINYGRSGSTATNARRVAANESSSLYGHTELGGTTRQRTFPNNNLDEAR